MKKKFSLRTELVFIILVFIIGVLGLIFFFQTVLIDDFYKDSKEKTIETAARVISNNIDDPSLEDLIDEISMSNEVCVRIVSNDIRHNIVRACSLRNLDNQTINMIASDTKNSENLEKLIDTFKYYRDNDHSLDDIYIYSKLIQNNNHHVLILVSTVVTPLAATIQTIKSQYLIITIVVIMMAILLALLLSKRIIRPIKSINNASKKLSKGEYNCNQVKSISSEFDDLNNTLLQANNEILKADIAKNELLSNVSHDLRTPLTMIVGYGEMIRDIKEENNEENINVIIDEAKRLSTLVDDLIDISKAERNDIMLHKQDISINELLSSVYNQYKKYCEAQNVSFELRLIEDKTVNVDVTRISQVLYNFINNSLNYSNENGAIIVLGTEKYDDKYRIYVYDNGIGIDKKDLTNIWERYYKVDEEHKRYHIGSGIGLSLAKQLLIAHDINFGVDSIKGEYCKFYFDL